MPDPSVQPSLRDHGAQLARGVFPAELVSRWRQTADAQYSRIQSLEQNDGIKAVRRLGYSERQYLPQVSSICLEAGLGPREGLALLETVANSSLRELVDRELGGAPVCNLDQSWVRRQYPEARRPPGCGPHSWHQDGALLYPFDSNGAGMSLEEGLLRMVTCWVALTPCGMRAPGLELVVTRQEALWPPETLTEDKVRASFPAEAFWVPLMDPGDVILFSGGALHRTHVEPEMQSDRTSIELRLFPAESIPKRLAGDRFVRLPAGGKRIESGRDLSAA